MNRRSFFSRLAGLALVPPLARFARPPCRILWYNYTHPMTRMSREELIRAMKNTMKRVKWVPPGKLGDIRIYCAPELLDEMDGIQPR